MMSDRIWIMRGGVPTRAIGRPGGIIRTDSTPGLWERFRAWLGDLGRPALIELEERHVESIVIPREFVAIHSEELGRILRSDLRSREGISDETIRTIAHATLVQYLIGAGTYERAPEEYAAWDAWWGRVSHVYVRICRRFLAHDTQQDHSTQGVSST